MNYETELKYTLSIDDPNITFDNTINSHKIIKSGGKIINLCYLKLTYNLRCINCGYFMNKNGFKTVNHKAQHNIRGASLKTR